jgi:oxalate---CoA ligase
VSPSTPLADLIRRTAATRPDAAFLADARTPRTLTYRELHRRTGQWARCLDELGVAGGCAILIDIADPIEFVLAHLATIGSGRCSVPVDPSAPAADLRRTVAATRPVLVITDDPARAGAADLGLPCVPVGTEAGCDDRRARPTGHAGSVRLSTSGSSGAPKAVELDADRLLHVATQVARHHELTPADRGYNPLPLFHINAQVVAVLATLVAGGGLVLDRRWHRSGFWTLLREHQITWVNAVPAVLAIAVSEPMPMPTATLDRPSRLRFVRSASAPLPAAVRAAVEQLTGVPVVESYGMTEAASQITATPLHAAAPKGSAGRPVGVELQIRDNAGSPQPAGAIGAVWIRGRGVIANYLDGREPQRFDAEHWLATGDLGHLDADGFLFLAGRADDVINRGGEMVYPREVEEVLAGDHRVREAIVVAAPDPVLGSVPVAYVLLHDQTAGDVLDALAQRCARQLSRFKRPARIELVTDLPRAATGKVLRHRLGPARRPDAAVPA